MSAGRPRARLISPVLWAFFCALLIRALLPAGVMVSADAAAGQVIVLCSGSGPLEAVLEDGHLEPLGHKHGVAHQHGACPFAGGHAYVPPADPERARAVGADWTGAPAPLAPAPLGALRLRAPPPPSQAPPAFSS